MQRGFLFTGICKIGVYRLRSFEIKSCQPELVEGGLKAKGIPVSTSST